MSVQNLNLVFVNMQRDVGKDTMRLNVKTKIVTLENVIKDTHMNVGSIESIGDANLVNIASMIMLIILIQPWRSVNLLEQNLI